MPLKVVAIFWSVTLLLYYLDPFGAYAGAPNQLLLLTFMIPNLLILLVVDRINFGVLPAIMPAPKTAVLFFRCAFIVALVLLPFNVYTYTGSSLREFFVLLSDPVEAYSRMHFAVSADRSERLGFLLAKLSVSWLTVALVPLAILLHKTRQIGPGFMVAALTISFIQSIFRGTDKELGDLVVFLIGGMLLAAPNTPQNNWRRQFRLFSRNSIFVLAGGALFLYFFAFRKSERLAGLAVHCFQNSSVCMEYPSSEASVLQFLVMMLYRYATHGYYGLSLSFDTEWTPCPFIGDSRVMRYIFEYFGTGCATTITDQLNNLGWSSRASWSTGFAQLADNFGHLFVYPYIIFFAVAAKIFQKTFSERGCYLSGVMFMLNFFILFYMAANLQLQQVGEQYFGYLILNWVVLLSLLTRRVHK